MDYSIFITVPLHVRATAEKEVSMGLSKTKHYSDIGWLLERPIAHRGYHSGDGRCPENSLAAFEAAIKKRFPIELDVRLLKDGNAVVFHDANAKRMTGIDAAIGELVLSDLKYITLLGSQACIPLLEEALDLINGRVPALVEIKNTGMPGKLEKRVAQVLSAYLGRVAVQSFNPHSLRWFNIQLPSIPRGQVAGIMDDLDLPVFERFFIKNLLLNRISMPQFIPYECKNLPSFPASLARKRGIPILAWTVTTREEQKKVIPFCDNVIFEGFNPDVDVNQ